MIGYLMRSQYQCYQPKLFLNHNRQWLTTKNKTTLAILLKFELETLTLLVALLTVLS